MNCILDWKGKVLPCVAPAGTLAFSSWVLCFRSLEQYQGCVVCLAWVHHFSFGFLLENVIFNLLHEKKGIILLLLLEDLLNAFEWNSGAVYCSHPPWPVNHREWVRPQPWSKSEIVSWEIYCYCSKGHLWSRYLSSKKKNLKRTPNYLKKEI